MRMPRMLHTPVISVALLVLAGFSTVACSTTTDPMPAEASANAATPADAGNTGNSGGSKDTTSPVASDRHAAESREFAMRPGDSTALAGGGSLHYLRMVNDSRCKPDVQCIWAGDAELSFLWQQASGKRETFSLHTSTRIGEQQHTLGTQRLTLLSLAPGPAPEARLRIEPAS